MRLRPVFVAATLAISIACWFAMLAQQQSNVNRPVLEPVFLDPTQVTDIAGAIAQRSARLRPMLEQVHAQEWIAIGAPDAYVQQWSSLEEQNQAIETDMTAITQRPEAMQEIIRALFRVHRFDNDLDTLLKAVRRYQNPALADSIESIAPGDQNGVEKLQRYVLELAGQKEQLLDIENQEAQRCRSALAHQPVSRPAAPKKTDGTTK